MPAFDRVPPNPAVKDLSKAKIGLSNIREYCSKGNPDKIESSSASKYGKYDISGFDALSEADHEQLMVDMTRYTPTKILTGYFQWMY